MVVLHVGLEAAAALHGERLRAAGVRPTVDHVRDAAADPEARRRHGPDPEDINAHALLERVEGLFDLLGHEADGTDLHPGEPVIPIGLRHRSSGRSQGRGWAWHQVHAHRTRSAELDTDIRGLHGLDGVEAPDGVALHDEYVVPHCRAARVGAKLD